MGAAGTAAGVCCEPDELFLQCNSVALLSFHLHDRVFGTSYAAEGRRLLDWARGHMAIPGTRLFGDDFRPSTGRMRLAMAGYANAWIVAFLSGIPEFEGDAKAMYADWRRFFPIEGEFIAVCRGAPPSVAVGPEEAVSSGFLATAFGALAARSMGDRALARKLSRSLHLTDLVMAGAGPALSPERAAQVRTFRVIALVARTFRGWRTVLARPV